MTRPTDRGPNRYKGAPTASEVNLLRDALRDLRILEDVEQVLKARGQSLFSVLGHGRTMDVAASRHWLMLVVRLTSRWGYVQIGKLFRRDHTTVIVGCEKAQRASPPFAPIPEPRSTSLESLDERGRIAMFLQCRADQLCKDGMKSMGTEVERLAGIVRRGEDKETDRWLK